MNLLETPFQKCIRLLQSASSSVTDPAVKKQLQRVEKLLADPDSLHTVKERYIRCAILAILVGHGGQRGERIEDLVRPVSWPIGLRERRGNFTF